MQYFQISDKEQIADYYIQSENDIKIAKSGIDLDFDIYQKENTRVINETHFHTLVYSIAGIVGKTLNLSSCSNTNGVADTKDIIDSLCKSIKFHMVVLRKPNIVESKHPEYGNCYKESFRIRIPGIKITKEHKKYIIHLILERDILPHIFNGIQIINPWIKVLDPLSATHPIMILGSAKRGSLIAHEFFKLYLVSVNPSKDLVHISSLLDFDPVVYDGKPLLRKDPIDGRKKIPKSVLHKFKYNLCYELSIIYEAPFGVIKKREYDPIPEIETEIQTHFERTNSNLISRSELEEIKNNITDLSVRDYDISYLAKILEILAPNRVQDYEKWRNIIYIIAWHNPAYKPLAQWFSYRFPTSWVNNGLNELEKNWTWALTNKNSHGMEENTLNSIFVWAKQDNPVKYEELQEFNSFIKLKKLIFDNTGRLHESHIASVLFLMYGRTFIYDKSSKSRANVGVWYEFVFPDGDVGRVKNSIYKWRVEKGQPDSLDKFISNKLTENMRKVMDWIIIQITDNAIDEDMQKHYEVMKKNINETIFNLGKDSFIKKILARCEVKFRQRGFDELLDTNTDVIGVGNGVLKVQPELEFIQRFHDIPISRSTNVDYEPIKFEVIKANTHKELIDIVIKTLLNDTNPLLKNS